MTRMVAGIIGVCLFYAVVPVDPQSGGRAVVTFAAAFLMFALLTAVQLRAVLTAPRPVLRAVEGLALALTVQLALFALTYLALSRATPGSFSEPLDRVGALYLAVSIASTVGFGDVVARTDAARLLVIAQIAVDLVVFVGLVRGFVMAARTGSTRRDGSRSGGGAQ